MPCFSSLRAARPRSHWLPTGLVLILLARHGQAQVCFESNQLSVGDPYQLTLADLDGDGDLDLAITNRELATVSVRMNLGDGAFAPGIDYQVDGYPISIAAADLDGDGDMDLVVANALPDTVSVLMNHGDGTFAPQVRIQLGPDPYCVICPDVDGDGDPDLVVTLYTSHVVAVLLNQGDGTFGAPSSYNVGVSTDSVIGADFDGDGDIDLAVATNAQLGLSVLLNRGNGTYAAQVAYAYNIFSGALTSADLDADGDIDLALADLSGNVSVLANQGDATFVELGTFVTANNSSDITSGDLDGDGYLDLAVSHYVSTSPTTYRVTVLINQRDGTFAQPIPYNVGQFPTSIHGADLDGDGDLELVTTDNVSDSVTILRNCRTIGHAACFGDGVDPNVTTPCPCGNFGTVGHGCGNSVATGGALLSGSGTAVPDMIELTVADVPPSTATIFLQGTTAIPAGIVFGDGVRCAGGQLIRLGAKIDVDSDGSTTFGPASGDPQISAQGGVVAGNTYHYQTYYRNPDPSWCPPATFNISNGLTITWN